MKSIRNVVGGMGNIMFKEAYIRARMLDGDIPDIYLQDERYFKGYEKHIKEVFGEGIDSVPYVSIHVRRGDYIGSNFHTDLTEADYYERAISLFPNKKFLVFSDDPDWCFKRFPDEERFLVENKQTDLEDFNLMASCSEGNIIANSTFSWWAAYVNPNFDVKVVAPKEDTWFQDKVVRTKLPPHWMQI